MFRNMFRKQFPKVQDAWILAHTIVDTVREPLIVLDQDLRVDAASRSFYLTFKVDADDTQGNFCMISETVNGIFRSFVCCLEKSFPSREPWKTTKSSMISRASASARCS